MKQSLCPCVGGGTPEGNNAVSEICCYSPGGRAIVMIEANYFDSERINCLIDGVQSKTAQKAMRFRQASSISLSGKQSNDGAGETGRPRGARTCGKETCGTVDCFRTKLVESGKENLNYNHCDKSVTHLTRFLQGVTLLDPWTNGTTILSSTAR